MTENTPMKNDNCLKGVECPHCGSQGPFRVPVRVHGDALVSDDGIEELNRSESEFLYEVDWRCVECGKYFSADEQCEHEPDPASVACAYEDVIDVNCSKCGVSGSFRVSEVVASIQW